jgi:hypothetical protein
VLEMRKQAEQQTADLHAWQERLVAAGWLERRRLVRELRTSAA